ncbi:MAG: MopE-related protein, partial [Myxococcales bacterium]|nr:MopE-related protein [Myxococcales bacterium]
MGPLVLLIALATSGCGRVGFRLLGEGAEGDRDPGHIPLDATVDSGQSIGDGGIRHHNGGNDAGPLVSMDATVGAGWDASQNASQDANQASPDGGGVCPDADCPSPVDLCPDDPRKVAPGQCGCGLPDTDSDDDGTLDCDETCDGVRAADYVPDNLCGVGYCQTTNTPSSCVAGVETACMPGTALSASDATCDGVDDDCDGTADENHQPSADCGVGYCRATATPSSCTAGVETACSPGTPRSASDANCDAIDDDCDGASDEDYLPIDSCGVGHCRTANTPSSCAAGVETACSPAPPLSASDATCDGIDDDCDASSDEDYVGDMSCGQGVCAPGSVASSCSGGVETACMRGTPPSGADDEGPPGDGLDNDCDGLVDEDVPCDTAPRPIASTAAGQDLPIPPQCTRATVQLWGAGGGGGEDACDRLGGDGGDGGYTTLTLTGLSGGENIDIFVGTGGTSGCGDGSGGSGLGSGGDGGDPPSVNAQDGQGGQSGGSGGTLG